MADEPTNGELARRLDDIFRNIQGLIGSAQYIADQRRIDDRLDQVRRDLSESAATSRRPGRCPATSRRRHASTRASPTKQSARPSHASRWKQILYTGLVPAFVVFLSILVQIWLHGGSK